MKRFGGFLITVALIAGMVACGGGGVEYDLTITSTAGGSVTTPGEDTYTYDEGEMVNLVATPDTGYRFVEWTGDVDIIGNVNDATITITMDGNYSITANFAVIPPAQYDLIISSTVGGEVTAPGEGIFNYDEGMVVDLVATPAEGYHFVNWTGNVSTIADVKDATTAITMNDNYYITANFAIEIWDWHDLYAIRDNLGGSYILMNDLDSTTAGYAELASPTANGGKGWEPIEGLFVDSYIPEIWTPVDPFAGSFDGQGYEIRDLFIDRPDEDYVGLFGWLDLGGIIQDVGMVNTDVIGGSRVGGLVGWNMGTVTNSYSSGSVTGNQYVGSVVGLNQATLSNSYSTCSVTGYWCVGGLVGLILGSGTVSNSYYNYDEVVINGENIMTVGALFGEDFEQWLANGKFLDVNERLSQEDGYYLINDVSNLKELLAFGQDGSLRFKLNNDLDLGDEPNFYIPYLAGEFDGNGYKISNLNFNFDSLPPVGLFGYLVSGGKVTQVGVENVDITGIWVGSLVGSNAGTVSNSYSTSGAIDGWALGTGGLVGINEGTMTNSYYNYDEVLINGENIITIGALFGEDFEQWLANNNFLNVNERLSQEDGYYVIDNVSDFKELLAFGQDDSLKFRLKNDLDLAGEYNFYVPYLAGEFDGNGHKISNLSLDLSSAAQVGLFGCLASGGKVSEVGVEKISITGNSFVGGLVGSNRGTVSNSYSTGSVTGITDVGGLVGWNNGTVGDSYSNTIVTGSWKTGGLMGWNYGWNYGGTVRNCYSTGKVTGDETVGGLLGGNQHTVSNCYWDIETSGQATSDGGTGKTTAQMKSIATFSGAGWNIIGVADANTRNTAYTWNIVDAETYPFLSWQPIS